MYFPAFYAIKKTDDIKDPIKYVAKLFRVLAKEAKFLCTKLEPANVPEKDTKFSVTATFPSAYSGDEFSFAVTYMKKPDDPIPPPKPEDVDGPSKLKKFLYFCLVCLLLFLGCWAYRYKKRVNKEIDF